MSFFTKKSLPKVNVVYDIDDDSVAVAIVSTHKKLPEIIWSCRYPVIINQSFDDQSYVRALQQALERVQSDIAKKGLPLLKKLGFSQTIQDVRCVLGTRWHTADSMSSSMRSDDSFVPTDQHLREAQKQIHQKFIHYHDNESIDTELEHVSHRVLRILGDNQPVSLTQSRPINRLDVQMYISKIPRLVKHMIKRVLVQTYQTRSITFHSSFESINNALMITNRKLRDFIFILPGRGRTTIVSSRYGSIHRVSHVPIGEDFLVRTISTALNRPHHDIRSRIQLRKKNRHHPAGMREMNIALDEISRRWLQSTYKEIESMTRGNSPQTVFVSMTDSNTGKVFGEFASRLKTYESKLQISNINTEHFSEYIENHRLPDYRLTMSVLGTCGY